jgi:aminomethyltransferase
MSENKKTVFYDSHISLGAEIVEFNGWDMPLQYGTGIINEHLTTRKKSGLFDISHMGRFLIRGRDAIPFLQHVLTNNAAALEICESQYTIVPNEQGGAIDDAYLYRFVEDEYVLVVNASNTEKVWNYFQPFLKRFNQIKLVNATSDIAMVSLQGPYSREIILSIIDEGIPPEPLRNELSIIIINGSRVLISRTGYTGEPICFELFINRKDALAIWDLLLKRGASPIGLGARDTLRLEAGLPLYGHELGLDAEGREIPIYSIGLSQFAVSFSPLKDEFVGKIALEKQFRAFKQIINRNYELIKDLPKRAMMVELLDRGIARKANKVYKDGKFIGYVTSGTMVPYWKIKGEGIVSVFSDEYETRAICLALLDSDVCEEDKVEIDIRGRNTKAVVMPYFLRSEAPPYARAITYSHIHPEHRIIQVSNIIYENVQTLIKKSIENTVWRQHECVNLIPSEQTPSKATKLLSIMDPAGRYAEHKQVQAFNQEEVFYYQGTNFISEVENLLKEELAKYLECSDVETRVISGQMANMAVFSALVDFLNRGDRKSEQRRIRQVLNHHIIKGGHLSAQPMGALKEFVARDPKTEKPAVINFPILVDDPYKIDIDETKNLIAEYRPELIILGRSVTIYKEPVAEIRSFINEIGIDCILMYDMAHVLGLVGPYFQNPFAEGADVVTGSTHKTFFGTQRGIVACDYKETDLLYELWEVIQQRTFPGSVSNHHLGTLLGLLMATYEMNYFKNDYQKKVLSNAKAFARSLKECNLDVAGNSEVSHTETHQVIVNVGYAKGPEIAKLLEENNIIVNYQATAFEEGFTASGALRMGVAEMTRFGMEAQDFQELAQLIAEVVIGNKNVKKKVISFRKKFLEMKYCFYDDGFDKLIEELKNSI